MTPDKDPIRAALEEAIHLLKQVAVIEGVRRSDNTKHAYPVNAHKR